MSYVQLSEGGFPGGLPPLLVVPVPWSPSPIWIWLENYLHLHLQHHELQAVGCGGFYTNLNACDKRPAACDRWGSCYRQLEPPQTEPAQVDTLACACICLRMHMSARAC